MSIYESLAEEGDRIIDMLTSGLNSPAVALILNSRYPEAVTVVVMEKLVEMRAIKTFGHILKTMLVSERHKYSPP